MIDSDSKACVMKGNNMSWKSLTGNFSYSEIAMIESEPIEALIQIMLVSDPIVALRVFRELLMHNDETRVRALVIDPSVGNHIAKYEQDAEKTGADIVYANMFNMLVRALAKDE